MPERTAAEVLAEKLRDKMIVTYRDDFGSFASALHLDAVAARLAEDPAITVRTDMVVERFIVEFHRVPLVGFDRSQHTSEAVKQILTTENWFVDNADHRIVVRPYPEGS